MGTSAQIDYSTAKIDHYMDLADGLRSIRCARAAQSWRYYSIGAEVKGRASLIAPPQLDRHTNQLISNHYNLDFASCRCDCLDQVRIDLFAQELRRVGLDWSAIGGEVMCKHHMIFAFIKSFEQSQAQRALEAELRYRVPDVFPEAGVRL
jgi:hypothetical protein